MRHRILTVCTANVCRSPVVEAMLAHRLDPERFVVSSAGVRAPRGTPIDRQSAEQLWLREVPVLDRTARQLTRDIVAEADLVLTATRAHRADVLDLEPRALRRTFTVLEFAALCTLVEGELSDGAGPNDLVEAAATARTRGPADVDLRDPIGRSTEVHAGVATRIDDAVATIVAAFGRVGGAGDRGR